MADVAPNQTVYVSNLVEKVKKEGEIGRFGFSARALMGKNKSSFAARPGSLTSLALARSLPSPNPKN